MTVTQEDPFQEGSAAQEVVHLLQPPEPATCHDEISAEQLAGRQAGGGTACDRTVAFGRYFKWPSQSADRWSISEL